MLAWPLTHPLTTISAQTTAHSLTHPFFSISSYNFANGAVHALDSEKKEIYLGGIIGGFDSHGNELPPQKPIPDPVLTHSNEVYYEWCTSTRYADTQYILSSMHQSSKHAAMIVEETTGTRAKQLFSKLGQMKGSDIFEDLSELEFESTKIPFQESSIHEKG